MTQAPNLFFQPGSNRATAAKGGFRFGHVGTHSSRTMMLEELATVLAIVPDGKSEAYATAIVEENCLGKQTVATRRHSLQHLRELYGLDPSIPLFRVLSGLWHVDATSGPLLALLSSLARDPLLRATAAVIIDMPEKTEFQRSAVREALADSVQDRLNESTTNKAVRNAASTWSQAGHLEGRTFKFRRLVQPTPSSIAFALYLARVAGFAVKESLTSGWIKVLDCSTSAALELAMSAKRMGLIDLRMAGDIIDLNLNRLDPFFSSSSQTR
jgi:hypothetical protein